MNNLEKTFSIKILSQSWLNEEPSVIEYDMCSHGDIEFNIGGVQISDNFGVSESALALLRTLESNHTFDNPVAQQLIFHGCGTMLMMGCPIGIDWEVRHKNNFVLLDNLIHYETTNERNAIKYPDISLSVAETHYKNQIIRFAEQTKAFFIDKPRKFSEDYDRRQFVEFWQEFDQILERHQ